MKMNLELEKSKLTPFDKRTEVDEQRKTVFKRALRTIFEIEMELGIRLTDYESFDDFMSTLFGKMSTETLKVAFQVPGDRFKGLIEMELQKRRVTNEKTTNIQSSNVRRVASDNN